MKKVTIRLYEFSELRKDAQQKVIEQFSEWAANEGWHESVYEDAARINVVIEESDIDYNKIKGGFSKDAIEVAESIFEQHGNMCDTYKIADKFKERYYKPEADIETLEDNFLDDILQEYLKMLKQEYEYQTSEKAIKETIECNEYYFYFDGTVAPCTTYTGKHEKAGTTELKFHGQTIAI